MTPLYHKRTGLTATFQDPHWKVSGFDHLVFITKKEAGDFMRTQPDRVVRENYQVASALTTIINNTDRLRESVSGLNTRDGRRVLKFVQETQDSLRQVLAMPAYNLQKD